MASNWVFSRPMTGPDAGKRIAEENPFSAIGSPPCTMFSSFMIFNRQTMESAAGKRKMAEAHVLLDFAIDVHYMQLASGRQFLHEHPQGARSWTTDKMRKLMDDPRVGSTVAHMCQFGTIPKGADGSLMPVKKATTFESSSQLIVDEISKRCDGSQEHQPLVDGRARRAQIYPPRLCQAMLRGIDRQRIREGAILPERLAANLDSGCVIYACTGRRRRRSS